MHACLLLAIRRTLVGFFACIHRLFYRYGPGVDGAILRSLSLAFGDLRAMADSGQITYPYVCAALADSCGHDDAIELYVSTATARQTYAATCVVIACAK